MSTTLGDRIGTIVTGAACVSLFALTYVRTVFARMFLDFGAREQLPALTQVMLHPVTPLAMAGTASALFAWGLTLPLQRQRVALTGVLLLALVFVGLFLIGMYLPIFQIAGAIQAE